HDAVVGVARQVGAEIAHEDPRHAVHRAGCDASDAHDRRARSGVPGNAVGGFWVTRGETQPRNHPPWIVLEHVDPAAGRARAARGLAPPGDVDVRAVAGDRALVDAGGAAPARVDGAVVRADLADVVPGFG